MANRRIIQRTHEFDIKTINPPWFFEPWIGHRFGYREMHGLDILVVGESHYGDYEDERLTLDCVNELGIEHAHPRNQIFLRTTKLLLGKGKGNGLSLADREFFWHRVSFCNYIQEGLPDRLHHRPTDHQWATAEAPFRTLLQELQPDLIVAMGKAVFDHLPKSPDGIPCCWSYHPASQSKFSYDGSRILAGVNEARERLGLPALENLCLEEVNEEELNEESELLEAVNEARGKIGLPALESLEVENRYPIFNTVLCMDGVRRKAENYGLSDQEFLEALAANDPVLLEQCNALIKDFIEELGASTTA